MSEGKLGAGSVAMWRMGSGKTTSSGRGVEARCMNAPKERRGQGGAAGEKA